ncbi:MAG: NAD(P)/FAD-dependent oxidoreductase [Acidobacteria bacterium]|nr:NAD(P)/FAD-dependent oxidoreductase [Acidobacteriota bacterium]
MDTTRIDTAVIGAGVVGLATARAIARGGRSVCVLERDSRPGRGTSTRNSQVIHAGLYYPANSVKAKDCVDGARMLYEFCSTHGVPYARCGKLVIAADVTEIPALEALQSRGRDNGVEGLEIVDRGFIRAREPHVSAAAALYSPHTGIVDAERLIAALYRECSEMGVIVLLGTPLVGMTEVTDGLELATSSERIHVRSVVNAAGLYADEVSALLGGDEVTIYPCRGEYAELVPTKRSLINGLVYPLPDRSGHSLGVHATRTIHGNVTFGPTVRFQTGKDDYESDRLPLKYFLEHARPLLPELTLDDLRLGASGIRPKLHPPGSSFADFRIERDGRCARLVQAVGIESPGLTACLAIGARVAKLVEGVPSD